jgi:hypothetical protein
MNRENAQKASRAAKLQLDVTGQSGVPTPLCESLKIAWARREMRRCLSAIQPEPVSSPERAAHPVGGERQFVQPHPGQGGDRIADGAGEHG